MGDSWQEYVEYNIRDHQDHKTPDEIHAKSERLRDTFDSYVQPIDHGIEHIAIHPRRQTIFLTGFVIKRAVLGSSTA
jgi:hypothetical protein